MDLDRGLCFLNSSYTLIPLSPSMRDDCADCGLVWFDVMTKHAGDTPQTRKAWRGIMWDAQTACCELSPIGDELWAVLSLTAEEYHSCITHPDSSTGNITDNDGAVCKYLESGAYFFSSLSKQPALLGCGSQRKSTRHQRCDKLGMRPLCLPHNTV